MYNAATFGKSRSLSRSTTGSRASSQPAARQWSSPSALYRDSVSRYYLQSEYLKGFEVTGCLFYPPNSANTFVRVCCTP
jgi:hypothetical protein